MLFVIGEVSFASAIIQRSNYAQPTNIIRTNKNEVYSNYDYEAINNAIKELKNQIKKSPNNYLLTVALADLYLKTKQFDKSFAELVYLNNLNQGNKLQQSEKQALSSLYNTLKSVYVYESNKSPIYSNMAILALIIGENDKAEKYINAAATGIGKNELLFPALIKVFNQTQNYTNAINICDRIINLKPSDIQARKVKAMYLLQMGDKDGAIKEYSIVSATDGTDLEIKYELFNLLKSKNYSHKDIIYEIYKNDNLNPQDAYYNLAQMLLKNNNMEMAGEYAKTLIEKYPDSANGYILLAEIYRKEGKLQEAYEVLSKIRDRADSTEAVAQYNVLLAKLSDEPLKEANSLMATGLYKEAIDVLNTASQENLYIILAQARANYFAGNKQSALDYLNKAMTLYPNNSDVLCAFAYIYKQEGDIESAQKYIKESLTINPNNNTAKDLSKLINKSEADNYVNDIIRSFETQNYEETMKLINEALEISPDYGLLHYYKGLTYIAQNNYASSTASLYKSLAEDKNNIMPYFYLGIAFDNLSEPENALVYYEKFLKLLPSDAYDESEKRNYAQSRVEKLKK